MAVTDVDSEFSSRRDKARTKPKRIISASVTIFAMSDASVRAPISANGFIACQTASTGSLLNATKLSPGLQGVPKTDIATRPIDPLLNVPLRKFWSHLRPNAEVCFQPRKFETGARAAGHSLMSSAIL
jgi:hypothetical protein